MVVGEIAILFMLVLGAGLMVLEAVAPGSDLIVVGITLFATGLTAWLLPGASLPLLLFVFVGVGISSFYGYRKMVDFDNTKAQKTDSSSDLEYREGTTIEDITSEKGKVKLDEGAGMTTEFQARCKYGTISKGTRVIVTDSGGGSILEVMPSEESERDKMLETSEQL
jgi:membrane protein implicated in regulation of membrane protease activity